MMEPQEGTRSSVLPPRMAKQPESNLKDRIKKKLRCEIGGKWTKIHGGPYQESGLPDLIGCVNGFYFGLEVKIPGETPTKIQEAQLQDIQDNQGVAAVVTSPEEAISVVRKALRKKKLAETDS